MNKKIVVSLVVLAIASMFYPVYAQPEPVELELKSYWPGNDGGGASSIEVVGDYVYVAAESDGLMVIDVSDPANPVLVSGLDLPDGRRAVEVEVAGNLAFVIGERCNASFCTTGVYVIDVSDSANPVEAGELEISGFIVAELEVVGNLAVVPKNGQGLPIRFLSVIDISDPANLVEVGSLGLRGYVTAVEVVGNLAFLVVGDSLQAIDVSDPANPVQVGGLELEASRPAFDLEVAGNFAFVGSSDWIWTGQGHASCELQIVDIRNPANPVQVGSLQTPDCWTDLAVLGNLLCTANGTNGIQVIDISNPADPVVVGSLDTQGIAVDVEFVENYIYVADDVGLAIIEILPNEIIPSEAIEDLILAIEQSSLDRRRQRPLNATLKAALASIDQDQVNAAVNQLNAFQNKARAQVTRIDSQLTEDLIGAAQEIIDALLVPPPPPNIPPLAHPYAFSVQDGETFSGQLSEDADGDPLMLYYLDLSNLPDQPQIALDGSFTYTPKTIVTGNRDSFSFFVSDGIARSESVVVQVTILPPLPNMVWIEPGTFMMGSPTNEADRDDDEGPQTTVTISRGYWMGIYEVTQKEYVDVTGRSNPSSFQPPNYTEDLNRPVENVNWNAATNYCGMLTERERSAGRITSGYQYRLPTEAEWEYVCRAGTTTRFSYGDDPGYSNLGDYAWYTESSDTGSGRMTHPVGQKLPNPWGLYDMHGNVWEWCQDWYAGSYPGGGVTDPTGPSTGPSTGSVRVGRGGHLGSLGWDCRSADRFGRYPYSPHGGIGFRVVLAPGQP